MLKKMLAVGLLVLGLGVVAGGVASAHDPISTGKLFATPFRSAQNINTFAFRLDVTDVHARTGAENGTDVQRV
jgi:hypothetical protein